MSELDQTASAPPEFPGDQLRTAREQHDISVEQVCRQLHLHAAVVQAIESGDLARLGDPVFARGYIRAYANYLKLDPKPFVDAFNRATGHKSTTADVKAIGTVSMVPGRRQGHPVLKIGSWFFILALIGVFLWWWQAQYGFDDSIGIPALDEPVSVDSTADNTLDLPPVEPLVEPLAELNTASAPAAVAAEVEAALAPEEAAPAPAPETVPEQDAGSIEEAAQDVVPAAAPAEDVSQAPQADVQAGLVIVLSEDCWLSVKAESGRMLYSGVAQGGTTLELAGEEPLSVVVGRVSAVSEFSYNGEPIDLAARASANVARLSLPL
ncbi:helix-turn-helix domain-containing protein [Marinobacterium sp. AK62]|uniref:Helix-turn-helix domain-containing protein n=1 Tax=Marinobacterium alkalitolerans TaxID=1542925 RepID=A0ABS3Z7T6_9GAMM|nr:RodZ domain-containing protein [Marinobacterium alkalitolerans]MBP0047767.1 helix-turn-helix domain-containing protein [Marinobacterium alkalitolerans]